MFGGQRLKPNDTVNAEERGEFMRRIGLSDEEMQQTRSVRREADEVNCERERRASVKG